MELAREILAKAEEAAKLSENKIATREKIYREELEKLLLRRNKIGIV